MKKKFHTPLITTLLFLTINSLLYPQYAGWTVYTTQNSGIGGDTTLAIFSDNSNNLWFGTVNGAAKFDGITWTTYNSSNSPFTNYIFVNGIEQIADTMYFSFPSGVYKFFNDTWELISVNQAAVLKKDASNILWIGTDGNGLYKYAGNSLTVYNTSNSPLRSNRITDLEVDSQNHLWITMKEAQLYDNIAGIAEFDGNNWNIYYNQNSGLINENIHAMAIDNDGNLWFGADSLYLYKYDRQNWWYTHIDPSTSNWVNSLDVDSSNNLWIGCPDYSGGKGLYKYDGATFTNYRTDNSGLPNDWVEVVKVDNNNNKWIGTWNRLAKFDDAPRVSVLTPNGGESIQSLTTYNISWTYQFIDQINIDFTTNGGSSWITIANNISTTSNSYIWNVPVVAPSSGLCKIRITSTNPPGISDESDDFFTIFAKVSDLEFNPIAGTYNNPQTVFITCPTDSVDIFYTLDGSDPTQSSILYTGPLYLKSSLTLKAKAYKDGWVESDIKSGVYNFAIAGLNFQPPQGTYSTPQVVAISTISDSVNIYYTTDGTDPTQNSTLYTQPVNIDSTLILKARAYRSGWTMSAIKSGNYIISDQVINIIIDAEPVWYDSDFNGIESQTVDGSGTTISYGTISEYEWLIDGVIVDTGAIADIQLSSGTKYLTLRATSDLGITKQDSVEISVYVASVVTNGPITSAVGQLSENIFFATSTDDRVYRFDSTGNVNWTILTGGDIQSTTCISNQNNIYVGSSDTRLYAFDSEGTPKWDRAMGGVIVSSPSISNDSMVYVGVSTGRLFAVTESGSIQWNFQTGGAIYSSPSVSVNGDVLVGSDDGKLYCVSKDGDLNWSFTTVAPIQSSPAIGNDSTIVFGSNDGSVYKLNHSGGLVWSYDAGGAVRSSPVIDNNGQIYFGSENGKIICLTSGGNLVWEYNAGGNIVGSPALTPDGSVIVGDDNGRLLVISGSGEVLWYLQTQAAVQSPVLYTDNDLVIFGQNSGNIYIIKYPSSGKYLPGLLSAAEWPTFKGSNRRTGNKLELISDVDKNSIPLPEEYSLIQNFPNPFNPSTKIRYSVPQTSQVRIIIYDVLGNEIETLINEEKPAGTYVVKWDAVNLSSGIYIYRIKAGEFIQTKKMILLK